jgi:5'-methylthioadenosine phosphorylase
MTPRLGIIGGTGFYRYLGDCEEVSVDTPHGNPSCTISLIEVGGEEIAFLPRHGRSHDYLPADVPYKANLWALRELGVERILGFNTVGSLQPSVRRGDFVFCDQFVDRTSGRDDTFFVGPDGAHISTAEPYCQSMRAAAVKAVANRPETFHQNGTVVVIQGPRFSTKAESKWFSEMGWSVINMTQYPEVALARELELCYLNLSYVTDYDVAAKEVVAEGVDDPVSHAMVIREFGNQEATIGELIRQLIPAFGGLGKCSCGSALADARVGPA